jgi:pyruvate kinase
MSSSKLTLARREERIMTEPELANVLREVEALHGEVEREGQAISGRWGDWIGRENFAPSARNFAHYLAFRRHDVRPLQRRLMQFGLSSLGRSESRVLPTLDAVLDILRSVVDGATPTPVAAEEFFAGEARIAASAEELLGPLSPHSPVRLMVTLPSEAAHNAAFMTRLAELGVEAVRINCAHDDEDTWAQMIEQVDKTAERTGRRMKIFMDLAGPKIRTGVFRSEKGLKRVARGEELAIALPGQLDRTPGAKPAIECTLAEALRAAEPGHRILIDDGKLDTSVVRREPWGVVAQVTAGPDEKGYKLKPEKGVNFPDTDFSIPALTADDRTALHFVARHADGVEFSFVQSHEDVVELQEALARERPEDWHLLGLVLKIETLRAIRNLPDMLVRAAGRQPTAIMIARGDLAVEIGFVRLAEMQEEILWLGEAAHVPVIWATQVLESYLKTGVPTRGEMTDAAMAARAECVMLNKGPHLFDGIEHLDRLFGRMIGHISKKTPQLRRLKSW